MRTFVSAFGKTDSKHTRGAVVQLVRMPACHAGGRGFESLPHRKSPGAILGFCDVEGTLLQIKKFAKRTLDLRSPKGMSNQRFDRGIT